jgi:serine/threonine-protein kinase
LDKPLAAYKGTDSYVFVCYAHKDAGTVYDDLIELDRNSVKLWYDEGISAGTSWRAEIAGAIKGAKKFLFFISEASLQSSHCLREVDYAINHDIEVVPVYLDDSALPAELELVLNRVHALFRHTDSRYQEHLLEALRVGPRFTPLVRSKKKSFAGLVLSLLALGAGMAGLYYWSSSDTAPASRPVAARGPAEPNAFDRYLEGLDLVGRWDQGDNLERAIGLFREATRLDPDFALAYARLAEALRIRYALTSDEAFLAEAIASADDAMRLDDNLAPVQMAYGRIQATQGNFDLALAALQRAVSIDPNDAKAHQAIATVYERLGRLDDAEASFRKAIAFDPENIAILDSYANFLFRQSRFDEAIRQWQTVIRLAPDNFAALVNLGSALSETGRIAEAITVYQRAIELRPSYMAYSNLGTAYARAERYDEAEEAYRQALEIDATDWLAWGNLAFLYSWRDDKSPQATEAFARAIQLGEDARAQNPRDPFVHSDLGLYYAKIGEAELALQRITTALSLSADSGEIRSAAAETYELLGQRDKAIGLAREALAMGYPRQRFLRNPEMADLLADPRMQASP